jgi:hypothetical protein
LGEPGVREFDEVGDHMSVSVKMDKTWEKRDQTVSHFIVISYTSIKYVTKSHERHSNIGMMKISGIGG